MSVPLHRRPAFSLLAPVPGRCRVCGEPVAPGPRGHIRQWHDGRGEEPRCVQRWKMMTRPGWAKRELVRARGAICERCGAKPIRGYKWLHLDHVVPLIDGGTLEEQNLQLLCPECHLAKTLREQAARLRRTRLVVLRQLANRE